MATQRFGASRLFLSEFRRTFRTTGAVLPSSRWLAQALARYVGAGEHPQRILEVGPGTGAVTRQIISAMRPDDTLDLVELNERFVAHLNDRFAVDPHFRAVGDRAQVIHKPVEDLPADDPYDLIISGLPLNNFAVDQVESILAAFQQLLKPGGTLSFFEYIALREAKTAVSFGGERQRLRGIAKALRRWLDEHQIHRDSVWRNAPPAWVHHVRFGEADAETDS